MVYRCFQIAAFPLIDGNILLEKPGDLSAIAGHNAHYLAHILVVRDVKIVVLARSVVADQARHLLERLRFELDACLRLDTEGLDASCNEALPAPISNESRV